MTEYDMVYETKLKYNGLFDFKELYKFVHDWFSSYHYIVIEKKYEEKITAEGKDLEIEWMCLRKISDYFRFQVDIRFRIIAMSSVEMQRGNIKIKMNKAAVEIVVRGVLQKDYENRWERSPIAKFLRGVYDRYIIRSRIEDYEDKIALEVDESVAQMKAFLALEAK